MCGIAGFIGHGTVDDLYRMNSMMHHRGPDGEGFWFDAKISVFFAHKRLSILDIEGGSQPMWNREGTLCIIFNGEIYNHLEIRENLISKGHVFRTDHSDTEALLCGYEEWGEALVEMLNGMWAFAIYDKQKSRVFLSRDRFGKKPLYYTMQNGTFAFASELSALIQHKNILHVPSWLSLVKYFAHGFIPSPSSLFEKIYKLQGGYNIIVDVKSLEFEQKKYWEFVIEPDESYLEMRQDALNEQLVELLDRAVRRRMIADVPLGVFLSGGIDSSAIAYFASRAVNGNNLKTFSIGFKERSFDESAFSSRMAGQLHTDHQIATLAIDQALDCIPEIMDMLDEPLGDSSIVPSYLLCRHARKKVTVALGGDGGDELFAGYNPFHALNYAKFYDNLIPTPVHQAIKFVAMKLPTSFSYMSIDFNLKRTLRGLSYSRKIWNPVWLGPLDPDELSCLFNVPLDIETIYSEAISAWDNCKQKNVIEKTLQFYTRLYMQDDILAKIDRTSMMNSLEVRTPFLDIDLVDFVRKIPTQLKYRNGQTKYLLKKALERYLPKDIIYRPKRGFAMPVAQWFIKDLKEELKNDFFLKQSSTYYGMNKNYIKEKIDAHTSIREDNRLFLWCYYTLNRGKLYN